MSTGPKPRTPLSSQRVPFPEIPPDAWHALDWLTDDCCAGEPPCLGAFQAAIACGLLYPNVLDAYARLSQSPGHWGKTWVTWYGKAALSWWVSGPYAPVGRAEANAADVGGEPPSSETGGLALTPGGFSWGASPTH
jgi:hypothetical protein